LGVLLVLLAPCTDWFITFTHLARGDTGRAMTLMPVNLVLQLVLLPVYLWLMHGEVFDGVISIGSATGTFATIIMLPLVGAWGARRLFGRTAGGSRSLTRVGTLAVPLVAVVVFLVAASQVNVVTDSLGLLPRLGGVYIAFAVAALMIGVGGARLAGLSAGPARTLAFSVGTRNSFVVLPFALAVPEAYELAVVVVVFQSLVELLAMVAYLRAVPWLLPDREE
ncbi:MAG: arsenic resistance protein, partial [Acidimicrobiales bacterium]